MPLAPLFLRCFALAFASASLAFSAPFVGKSLTPRVQPGCSIEVSDPRFLMLIDPQTPIEAVAEGFNWAEGPVWDAANQRLLFSDVPENKVYAWSVAGGLSIFLEPSGFTGERYEGRERGANGLTFSPSGVLTLCQHGDRRVAQLRDAHPTFTTVADRFAGRRFSSPNDLCYNTRGQLFFTDPPYGLPQNETPELPQNGVYRVDPDGRVSLMTASLERPNGIALSPDGQILYVANSHGPRPVILAIDLDSEGNPLRERVFFDGKELIERTRRSGLFDGLKVDVAGNVWATGPGGVIVLTPAAELLGTILTGKATANCTFGDADWRTLYVTADDTLLRIRTLTAGLPVPRAP